VKKLKNKAARKQKKKATQNQLKVQTEQILNHPTECCICASPFERTVETVQTWMVTVREERVRLTCPYCWSIIAEAIENLEDKFQDEETAPHE
jgi:aspartate carbamoyltransferase regulatory subunit